MRRGDDEVGNLGRFGGWGLGRKCIENGFVLVDGRESWQCTSIMGPPTVFVNFVDV